MSELVDFLGKLVFLISEISPELFVAIIFGLLVNIVAPHFFNKSHESTEGLMEIKKLISYLANKESGGAGKNSGVNHDSK